MASTTSTRSALFALTALVAAPVALAHGVFDPADQVAQETPQPHAKSHATATSQSTSQSPQQPQAAAPPASMTEPQAAPSEPKLTVADLEIQKEVQDHLVTILGGLEAAEASLWRIGMLTSEHPADVGSVRRSTDLAKSAVHTANVAADKLDDMKALSGVAKTQVRDMETKLHDARDLVQKMSRESAAIRAPFTGGDAVRVNEMALQTRKSLNETRANIGSIAKMYDITPPSAEFVPAKPSTEKAPQ